MLEYYSQIVTLTPSDDEWEESLEKLESVITYQVKIGYRLFSTETIRQQTDTNHAAVLLVFEREA
jgi:hypothetical protein